MVMGKKNILITENQLTNILGKFFPSNDSIDKFFNFVKGLGLTSDTKPPSFKPKGKTTSVSLDSFSSPEARNLPDLQEYKKLLEMLDAPTSDENLKFMYAWRQAEGAGGRHNPFNTTLKTKYSTFFNYLNKEKTQGVQNYSSAKEGFQATYDTLQLKYYRCIVEGLQKDAGALNIATRCKESLKTWGTGDLVAKVLSRYEKGAPIQVRSVS